MGYYTDYELTGEAQMIHSLWFWLIVTVVCALCWSDGDTNGDGTPP